MKKTNRQNKTGLSVNWPTGFYTMESSESHPNIPNLWDHNKHFAALITLRVRLTNALENSQVVKLGVVKGSKGRPKLVFANTPVSQSTMDEARAAGVVLEDNIPNVVNVVAVKPTDVENCENVEVHSKTTSTVPETV